MKKIILKSAKYLIKFRDPGFISCRERSRLIRN